MYTQICIWVNTILNHIDTMEILPRYEGSYMVYRPEIVSKTKKNTIKYPYRNGIKICEILVTDIQMVANDQITRSELVRTYTMPTHGTYGTLGNFPSPRESTLPHARFSRW